MITIDLYRHGHPATRAEWYAELPGACGSGLTPWEALAEALTVWERRGRPEVSTVPHHEGGASWVVDTVIDLGRAAAYRYHVRGINLGCAPGTYGRRFAWTVRDLDNPRYEILPDAWSAWQCWTCTRVGRAPVPDRCPNCDSEIDERHGPHVGRTEDAAREAA